MNFSEALEVLKAKQRVRRTGWNGSGMYLAVCEGGGFRDGYRTQDFIYIKTAQDTISPWQPSNGDLFANDWEIAV